MSCAFKLPLIALVLNVTLAAVLCDGADTKTHTRKTYEKLDYWPVCFRNDPQLNRCLLNASDYIRPYLAKGVPELKIPPFEPLKLPQIELKQGTDALNFKATLKNVSIHGLTEYKFDKFEFDVPNHQFFCTAKIANLVLEGDYLVTGRILIAPIEGKGKFSAEVDSCNVTVFQKYKMAALADKKVHLVPTITNTSIEVENPKIHLDGLFGNNKELAAATNAAINDNVDVLFEELKPVVEATISEIMENLLIKSIINKIPYDELYPVSPNF
ncbi:uncharacterized protein [Euwallacea fornicatus]|uniref:uncharacterized protein isoform X2 n=1 Tax=Euwallacea fornicatus TaxID=995702 RepID=UPI00338EFC74